MLLPGAKPKGVSVQLPATRRVWLPADSFAPGWMARLPFTSRSLPSVTVCAVLPLPICRWWKWLAAPDVTVWSKLPRKTTVPAPASK